MKNHKIKIKKHDDGEIPKIVFLKKLDGIVWVKRQFKFDSSFWYVLEKNEAYGAGSEYQINKLFGFFLLKKSIAPFLLLHTFIFISAAAISIFHQPHFLIFCLGSSVALLSAYLSKAFSYKKFSIRLGYRCLGDKCEWFVYEYQDFERTIGHGWGGRLDFEPNFTTSKNDTKLSVSIGLNSEKDRYYVAFGTENMIEPIVFEGVIFDTVGDVLVTQGWFFGGKRPAEKTMELKASKIEIVYDKPIGIQE